MEAEPRPVPGQIVRVRSREHLVEDVVAPPAPGEDTRVRLSCLDDDAQGEQLEVLWERELDAELVRGAAQMRVADQGFDAPRGPPSRASSPGSENGEYVNSSSVWGGRATH